MESVAEKLTAIGDAIREKTGETSPLSLDGMAAGIEEVHTAGKGSERRHFWDIYQDNGNRSNYNGAFAGHGWTDENTDAFYVINCRAYSEMFKNAVNLTKTPAIISSARSVWTDAFNGAENLSQVNITGTIAKSIDFGDCPINVNSMKGIIEILSDFAGTSDEGFYSVIFSDACWQALEEDGSPPEGETWKDYVAMKGWCY